MPRDAEPSAARERQEHRVLRDAAAWEQRDAEPWGEPGHRELQDAGAWEHRDAELPGVQDEEPPGERGAEPWEVREVCS